MFSSSGAKFFQKIENYNFPRFFSFFSFPYHFLKNFASSGAKILQEMENYNFPRVFYHFFNHVFIMFFNFCFQWWN